MIGQTLGPYRILEKLGEGGMGEVYKGRDTRLDRTVAIKVLPPDVDAASREERRARFEQEARTIASINHPHICHIHDVGRDGDVDFLVMEHLQGETLEQRLHASDASAKRKPLKVDEAVDIAVQIAEALAAAHQAGVVHRDLKPANVMLTAAGAKLLDFGVAKRREAAAAGTGSTTTVFAGPMTTPGFVVGTVGYMSPEQARGEAADVRSDLFALGSLLYEMLSGQRSFTGATTTDVLTAILRDDPAPLPADRIPTALDRIVRHCLEKHPARRFQSARDVAFALESFRENREAPVGQRPAATSASRWLVPALAVLGIAVAGVVGWFGRGTPASPVVHCTISIASDGLTLSSGGMALSPDGRTVAFVAFKGEEPPRVYVRHLDEPRARPLPGTENAHSVFFKPDGRWLAFLGAGVLKKVMLATGEIQTLCNQGIRYQGLSRGAWMADGSIYFTSWPGGIFKTSESTLGGAAERLLPTESRLLQWPQVLPGGSTLIYTAQMEDDAQVEVLPLDNTARAQPTVLLRHATCARYVPGGYLVFESEGKLKAVAFDPKSLKASGTPRVVLDDVAIGAIASTVALDYDVSATGHLVALPAAWAPRRIVKRDRAGNRSYALLEPRNYGAASVSEDGRQFVASLFDWPKRVRTVGGRLDSDRLQLLTPEGGAPIISRDGRMVAFSRAVSGSHAVFLRAVDGSGDDVRLTDGAGVHHKPTAFSPDGKRILFNFNENRDGRPLTHVSEVPSDGSRRIRTVIDAAGGANDMEAVFSPDGRWLAYQSDETKVYEVYVRRYDATGKGQQVSIGGGMGPVWSRKGAEVFYQSATALMAVSVRDGVAGQPVKLFAVRKAEDQRREIDVLPDGRFLFVEPASSRTEMTLVQNWIEEVKAKVSGR